MPTVTYPHEFPYRQSPAGGLFPIPPLTLGTRHQLTRSADVIAYLDSDAQRSHFDGRRARLIGLDLLSGNRLSFASTAGFSIEAVVHPVRLSQPDLGQFDLEPGFSTVPLRCNLLGRDFFNLVQIGFRERQQLFYVRPES